MDQNTNPLEDYLKKIGKTSRENLEVEGKEESPQVTAPPAELPKSATALGNTVLGILGTFIFAIIQGISGILLWVCLWAVTQMVPALESYLPGLWSLIIFHIAIGTYIFFTKRTSSLNG